MSRNWLAVASAEHVEIGRNGGFMQVSHGKASCCAASSRATASSTTRRLHLHAEPCPAHEGPAAAFTAIGTVKTAARPGRHGLRLQPFRREVAWHEACRCVRHPSGAAAFTQEKNWGYRLRQGVIEISDADMTLIAEATFTAGQNLIG